MLGWVLDGSGFVRRARVFAGNAVEARTLKEMLEQLAAPEGAWVILDRGIATEENILWLKEHAYRYLVMARRGKREQGIATGLTWQRTARAGTRSSDPAMVCAPRLWIGTKRRLAHLYDAHRPGSRVSFPEVRTRAAADSSFARGSRRRAPLRYGARLSIRPVSSEPGSRARAFGKAGQACARPSPSSAGSP